MAGSGDRIGELNLAGSGGAHGATQAPQVGSINFWRSCSSWIEGIEPPFGVVGGSLKLPWVRGMILTSGNRS